jgi:xylan 1,4-beta-xylosidase
MSSSAKVTVNASNHQGQLPPFSLFFGCDEPNLANYPQGSELLTKLGDLGKSVGQQTYFRIHNLLTTGEEGRVGIPAFKWGSTNAYTEGENGQAIYDFTIVDKILDAQLNAGVKPYLQVGFMPRALATDPDPYFFHFKPHDPYNEVFTGWTHPPKDYTKWAELVFQWISHCVERYGKEECENWWYETWNEPDIGYWAGSMEEFWELHDHTVHAVRRALPNARVGGPDLADPTSSEEWLKNFIEHCLHGTNYATGEKGTPMDFLSWHGKGSATMQSEGEGDEGVDHIQMDPTFQLSTMDKAMAIVASYPELKDIPIVLGEFDPDPCAACTPPTSGYRNSLLYPSYTVMSFVRVLDLAQKHGVNIHGILSWAFEFEETESIPFQQVGIFEGYRVLSTQGIDKSVMNAHRLLARLCGGTRVKAVSDRNVGMEEVLQRGIRGQPDVGVLASLSGKGDSLNVLIWHYHDDEVTFPDMAVELEIKELPSSCRNGSLTNITHYRVDEEHSDAFSVWKAMGSPRPPSKEQYAELQIASQLALLEEPREQGVSEDGTVRLRFKLPIRGISLIVLSKT